MLSNVKVPNQLALQRLILSFGHRMMDGTALKINASWGNKLLTLDENRTLFVTTEKIWSESHTESPASA
jgi:hypothetical protein